jgi:DNA-binding beta-propeller fold protein YncE
MIVDRYPCIFVSDHLNDPIALLKPAERRALFPVLDLSNLKFNIMKPFNLLTIVLVGLLASFHLNAQTSHFHLVKKTVIGGEGGWDYLTADNQSGKIFLSHATQVEVLDLKTQKKIGTIPDVNGVHGIAIVAKINRGITSNGRANTATIFDLKTLAPIVVLPTGKNPDALLYDSFSNRVFVFNHSGGTAAVIDIAEGKVLGTVELGGERVEAGVSDGKGTIFVNLEDKSEIVSFDAKSLTVKNRWSIAPGEEPSGLAIDVETHRLFSVCGNELMMVINSDNGAIVTQVPIGKRVDGAVFDPTLKVAISSNGEGSITVVKEVTPDKFEVAETVETALGARTIALDSKTHHVYLSTAQYGETPAATNENPRPRPAIVPGTFMLLEYGPK